MTTKDCTDKDSMKIQEIEVEFPGYIKSQETTTAGENENGSGATLTTTTTTTFNLSGTLRLPSSSSSTTNSNKDDDETTKHPAAIIFHGSGPIDRDGNAIIGFPMPTMMMNTHSRLAEALVMSPYVQEDETKEKEGTSQETKESESGMAVLCYDKRGVGKSISTQNKDLYYEAGMKDLVDDAVQAYKFLVEHPLVDSTKIVLIGHSEGAILLPLINEEIKKSSTTTSLPTPKGLIFLAGFGETLDGAARNQRERMLQEVAEETGIQGFILRRMVTREKLEKQYTD